MDHRPVETAEWALVRTNHEAWTKAEIGLLPVDIEWLNYHRELCGQSATYPPRPPGGPGCGSPPPDNSWIEMESIT